MEGATFLTRVVLENYKSIAHCDVCLGPLNYLVGPNGAGKSNFLDGVRFVADALEHSVGHALRSRGGAGWVCHAAPKQPGYFHIHLEFATRSGTAGHYTLKVGLPAGAPLSAPWEVLDEKIGLPTAAGETGSGLHARHLPQERSFFRDRLALTLMADDPTFRDVYSALTRMRFYNIRPPSIKDIETYDPSLFLFHDGSNLASAFARLGASSGDATERIDEYLRLILPGLIQVRVAPVFQDQPELQRDSQKVALLFEQRFPAGTVRLFSPLQMSEGTLRSLGILTALFQAAVVDEPKPSLVAIEEPEAQVHPAVLAVLRDAMLEASYSTQVLVTTQSADLLDSKDVETGSILAVTADEGATHIAPIDAPGRDLIRRRLYTVGELLHRAVGPRERR